MDHLSGGGPRPRGHHLDPQYAPLLAPAITAVAMSLAPLIEVDRRLTFMRKEMNGSFRIPAQLLRWLVAEVHSEADPKKSAMPSPGDHTPSDQRALTQRGHLVAARPSSGILASSRSPVSGDLLLVQIDWL